MTMNHNAFVFDYEKFATELRPLLLDALKSDRIPALRRWIDANSKALVDPYEGKRLLENWQTQLPDRSVQTYGDVALTKFYKPTDSIGLDEDWEALQEALDASGLSDTILLGTPLGPEGGPLFDPGDSGTYFQTPDEVCENLVKIETTLEGSPELRARLEPVVAMLTAAKQAQQGLYVTF